MVNEKRLIDANVVMNGIIDQLEIEWGYEGIREDVKRIFENAPTVDAVELPPIKIGDTAYFIINGDIYKAKVYVMCWEQHEHFGMRSTIRASVHQTASVQATFDSFGKTVFLTEEEAKSALAKMDGGNDND